jgi:hypothetical protein
VFFRWRWSSRYLKLLSYGSIVKNVWSAAFTALYALLARCLNRNNLLFIHSFIHSCRSLSYDRFIASCKASSPLSAMQCFLFQLPGSSSLLKAILRLFTSSSLSSRLFYPSFYLTFNSVF